MIERDIFLAVIEQTDPAARSALLHERCGSDSALRHRLELMLRCYDQKPEFLETSAIELGTVDQEPESSSVRDDNAKRSLELGQRLGDYVLIERLGEGGFAEVFAARQEGDVERLVAIKILKANIGHRLGAERIEQERRLMATLNHPGIATMLDWGAESSGRPYLVMEWVNGMSLTEYCCHHGVSLQDRVVLMIAACRAVSHAHQRGVLHLDLKPSNILTQFADGMHQVKVIDFGIGRCISDSLSPTSGLVSLWGTPAYMSPERLRGDVRAIGPASDISSLGIVLREVLHVAAPNESSSDVSRQALESVRRVPREIQWIIQRATSPNPPDRYDSARDLGDDLERYLAQYPVLAGPASSWYVTERFLYRHRRIVGLAVVLAIGALASFAMLWNAWARAENAVKAERVAVDKLRHQQSQLLVASNALRSAEHLAAQRHYGALISEAAQASLDGDTRRATSLLNHCPETLRGWEWRFLSSRVPVATARDVAQLGGPVRFVEFVAPNRTIVYGTQGQLRLLDERFESIGSWQLAPQLPTDIPVAVHKSSATFMIARHQEQGIDTIERWDAHMGHHQATFAVPESHAGAIHAMCCPLDRPQVYLNVSPRGASHSSFIVINWTTGEATVLGNHSSYVTSLAVDPLATHFALTDADGQIWLWKIGQALPRRLQRDRGPVVDQLAFSADGRWLAAGSARGYGVIWDVETELSTLVRGHVGPVVAARFAPDCQTLVTAGRDGVLRRWSLPHGSLTTTFRMPDSDIQSLTVGGTPPQWIVGTHTGRLLTIDDSQLSEVPRRDDKGAPETQTSLVALLHPDEQAAKARLFSSSQARQTTAIGDRITIVVTDDGQLEWRGTGDRLVTGRRDAHAGPATAVISLRDVEPPNRCVSGGTDGVVVVWGIDSGQALMRIPIGSPVRSLAYDPLSDAVLVRDERGRIWSMQPSVD